MEIPAPYILLIFGGAGGVIAFLYRQLIMSKDKVIDGLERHIVALNEKLTDAESNRKTFQDITTESIKSAIETTNFYRARDGKPPLILPAAVIGEGSSPPTAKQRDAALAATYRAAMVIIKTETGQEPRREPGAEAEKESG